MRVTAGGNAVAAPPAEPHRPPAGRVLVPLLLVLGTAGYTLPMALLTPALPVLQRVFETTPGGAAWAVTSVTVAASIATPVTGRLGDMFGHKRILLTILGCTCAGLTVSTVAATLPVFLLGRVLTGAAAGVFPLAYAIMREVLPTGRAGSAIGAMSSMYGLGGMLGWVLSGPILDHLGWRWLTVLPLAALVPATLLAVRAVPESAERVGGRIDVPGALLFAGWVTCLLVAITEGASWGYGSARAVGLLVACVVLAGVWVKVELVVREPLVDMRMLRLRGVWTANLAALCAGYSLMAAGILMPLLVQLPAGSGVGFGGSATSAALIQLPGSIAMTSAGLLTGVAARRFGVRVALGGGSSLVLASYVFATLAHTYIWQLYAFNIVRGFGLGLLYAAMAALVTAAVPAHQTGAATGVNTLVRTLGVALGSQVSATLVATHVDPRTGAHTGVGFTLGFAVPAGLMCVALLAAVLSPRRRTWAEAEEQISP